MEPTQPSQPRAASWRMQYEGRLPCDDRRKERTGTYYMSVEKLQWKAVAHEVCHDLESFYWVLIWLVLRHTNHSLGPDYCFKLFKDSSDLAAAAAKTCWIRPFSWSTGERQIELAVTNNVPLTALIEDFRVLISRGCFYPEAPPPVPLAYDSVLGICCKAVADPAQWPESDFVRCTLTRPGDIVEDSVVSAQCDEIANLESEEDEDDIVVEPRYKDNERDDTDVAGQPKHKTDSPDDSAPAVAPTPAGAADSQLQGMTTRLRAKRKASAAAPAPSREGSGPSKRRKTDRPQAPGARISRIRGKTASSTRCQSVE